jgi:hypothetical protein
MTGVSPPFTIVAPDVIEQIVFTTAPQTIVAGATSTVMTIQTQDSSGTPVAVGSDTTVDLASTSGAGLFSLEVDPWVDITSVMIPIGQDSVSFYYNDTIAGTSTITASESPGQGWTNATQPQTIIPDATANYTMTSASYTQTVDVPFYVVVTAYDQFNNKITTDSTTAVTMTSSSGTMVFDGDGNGTFGEAGDNVKTLTSGTFTIFAMDTAVGIGVTITATDANTMTGTRAYNIRAIIDQIAFTTAPQTIAAGGVSNVMTIQTQDDSGIPVIVDSNTTVNLTSTSGAGLFSLLADPWVDITSVEIPAGQDSVSFYYNDTVAATPTITASESPEQGWTDAVQQQIINPGPITDYTVASAIYTQIAGVSFSVVVTAYDQFNNVVTTDSTTAVTMSSSSGTMSFDGDGNGTFGEAGDNVKTLTSGTFTIAARDTSAGTGVTITATDANTMTGISGPYTINPGPIASYTVTSVSYTHTAGVSFSVVVTAYDQFNNPVTTNNTTAVTMTSSSGTMSFDSDGNGTFGEAGDDVKTLTSGTFTIAARDTTAGTGVTITATDANTMTGISAPYTIIPGAIASYTVTSASYIQPIGVPFDVDVTAYDQFNNMVETDSTTVVTMTSSSGTMSFDGNGNGTFGEVGDDFKTLSSGTFTIVAQDTSAGTGVTITATDANTMTGTSGPYTIQPVITQIAFTTAPQTVVAGEVSDVMTIQTQDVTSNPLVVDVDTTVNLTSTSGAGLFSLLADPWSDVTSVVIPIGQDSVSFYYKDTVAATPTITAAEDPDVGWTDATQQQTIVPGPPALVEITDPTDDTDVDANVASIIIEAMVTDIYGNRVADNTFVSWTPADYGGGNEGTPSEGTIDRTTTTIDGITSATLITSTIAGDDYIVQASAGDATGISPVITVVGTVTIDPPDYIDAGDVPDDNGGWIYITYTLSTNDPFHSAAAGPAINYYVVERSTTPPPEPPDGYAYQAFAFINLYDPEDDDDASVVLEVPVTNELHNYRIAAVYNPSTSVSSVLGENSDGESDGPTIVYVGELAAEESGIQSEWVNCGDIAGADNLDAYTDMTVLLEGAVSGDAMTAMPEDVVPTTSPYADGATVEAVPDGVVDWIH